MRTLVALVVVLVAGHVGAGSLRPRIVKGEKVIPKRRFQPAPISEVSHLQFYDCTKARTKGACTAVTGVFTSSLPRQSFAVTITIDLYRISGTGIEKMGTAQADILEPAPGERIKFSALGPPCYFPEANGNDRRMAYHARIEVKPHHPRQ